jgi:hypoxanthine-guanine phosphoribosyltransferase
MKNKSNFEQSQKDKNMYSESRKILLIEDVLKVENDSILSKLENILKNSRVAKVKKKSIYDFVGIISNKEAQEMKKIIKETSETIHPDDWK